MTNRGISDARIAIMAGALICLAEYSSTEAVAGMSCEPAKAPCAQGAQYDSASNLPLCFQCWEVKGDCRPEPISCNKAMTPDLITRNVWAQQQLLNAVGQHVEVNGVWSEHTMAATKRFQQQEKNLTVDGEVDSTTAERLLDRALSGASR